MSETSSASETEVDCPGCGLTLIGDEPRPSAEWFCPRCDYPLFWVEGPAKEDRQVSRAARRRLPGAAGRTQVGAGPCWHCGEMNEAGETECLRCAATLPKPLAPTVHIVEEIRVPTPVPIVVRGVVWPFVAAAACASGALAIAVTRWILGAG